GGFANQEWHVLVVSFMYRGTVPNGYPSCAGIRTDKSEGYESGGTAQIATQEINPKCNKSGEGHCASLQQLVWKKPPSRLPRIPRINRHRNRCSLPQRNRFPGKKRIRALRSPP